VPRRSTAKSIVIPPPTMGWNTKDPISNMGEEYAIDCLNCWSDGATVDLRKGNTVFAGNSTTQNYYDVFGLPLQNGTTKILAVNGSQALYDITSGGVSSIDLSAGGTLLIDDLARAVVFRNKIFFKGSNSIVGSGTDRDVYHWDGVSASITASGFVGPGGDDKALSSVQVYKSRLYFTGLDLSIWYGGIDSITGTLTQFNFESIFKNGGYLLFAGGVQKQGDLDQQYFAAISNQGEILLYQGDAPHLSTWSLVGHYYIAPPVGLNSFFYWGSNLVIITRQGILLLSDVLNSSENLVFLSNKINNFILLELASNENSHGVSGVFFATENMLMFNLSDNIISNLLVMNTNTGSWWVWTMGGQISPPRVINQRVYAAENTNARILRLWDGDVDKTMPITSIVNQARTMRLRPAYNYLGDRSSVKQFTEARPILKESEGLTLTIDADVDYADTTPTSTVTDTADLEYKAYRPRCGLTGIGKAVSIRIEDSVTTKRRSIQAIEILWNEGDIV